MYSSTLPTIELRQCVSHKLRARLSPFLPSFTVHLFHRYFTIDVIGGVLIPRLLLLFAPLAFVSWLTGRPLFYARAALSSRADASPSADADLHEGIRKHAYVAAMSCSTGIRRTRRDITVTRHCPLDGSVILQRLEKRKNRAGEKIPYYPCT